MTTEDIFGGGGFNPGAMIGGIVDAIATRTEVTMDDLFEQQIDHEDVRRTEADALRPVGTYTTGKLMMVREVEGELDYNGNPNPRKGRTVFRYFGPASLVVTEKTAPTLNVVVGTEIKGFFTLRVSPERYNWDDGSPDTQSKLWVQAVKAYSVAYGERATSVGQVVEFLREGPVRIRVIQKNIKEDSKGEPRNDVVAVSAVKA